MASGYTVMMKHPRTPSESSLGQKVVFKNFGETFRSLKQVLEKKSFDVKVGKFHNGSYETDLKPVPCQGRELEALPQK